MGWGMEDPAGASGEQFGRGVDETWGESPRGRRAREGLLVVLFIVLAAGAIWWTVERAHEEATGADPAVRRVVVVPAEGTDRIPKSMRACIKRAGGDEDRIMECIR